MTRVSDAHAIEQVCARLDVALAALVAADRWVTSTAALSVRLLDAHMKTAKTAVETMHALAAGDAARLTLHGPEDEDL
jgi:hypothetical protein